MAWESDRFPDEIHLYAASLDEADDIVPQGHVHFAERPLWFDVEDELPATRKATTLREVSPQSTLPLRVNISY